MAALFAFFGNSSSRFGDDLNGALNDEAQFPIGLEFRKRFADNLLNGLKDVVDRVNDLPFHQNTRSATYSWAEQEQSIGLLSASIPQ